MLLKLSISGAIVVSMGLVGTAYADNYVNGYTRNDGTYVQPHYQTNPNSSKLDNYSTQGNVNPYTGKAGTVDPYRPSNNYGGYSGYGSQRRN